MKTVFASFLAVLVSLSIGVPAWAQTRAVGAHELVLDDGSGHTLTIETSTMATNQIFTFPAVTSYTPGSVLFADGSGAINQNNPMFFWDNTNNRLGIGNAAPAYALDVTGAGNFTGALMASTATVNPGATNATALTVMQTSAGIPSTNIFQVTQSNGINKYLSVAKNGQVNIGDGSTPGTLGMHHFTGGGGVQTFVTSTETAARNIAFPDNSGTVALTSDITGGTLAGSFTTVAASGNIHSTGGTVASGNSLIIDGVSNPRTLTGDAQTNIVTTAGNINLSPFAGTVSITGGLTVSTTATITGNAAVVGTLTAVTAASGLVLGTGANGTTLSSTATSARAISFPNAAGTLALSGGGATYQAQPADPVGNANVGTFEQMGLAGSITPNASGKVLIIISGNITNNTAGDNAFAYMDYGTGTVPGNGVGATGTLAGNTAYLTTPATSIIVPFSCTAVVNMTVGTTYWIDLALVPQTGGTASVNRLSISAMEMP